MSTAPACSDAELIAGGPEAFERLLEPHHARIHGWLRRRLTSAVAEDLAAEVFVRAWAGREGYDVRMADASPWLFGIASNLARRHYRQERRALRAFRRSGVWNPWAAAASGLNGSVISRNDGRKSGIAAWCQRRRSAAAEVVP